MYSRTPADAEPFAVVLPLARLSTCLQIVGESAGLRLVYTPAAAEVVLELDSTDNNFRAVTVCTLQCLTQEDGDDRSPDADVVFEDCDCCVLSPALILPALKEFEAECSGDAQVEVGLSPEPEPWALVLQAHDPGIEVMSGLQIPHSTELFQQFNVRNANQYKYRLFALLRARSLLHEAQWVKLRCSERGVLSLQGTVPSCGTDLRAEVIVAPLPANAVARDGVKRQRVDDDDEVVLLE